MAEERYDLTLRQLSVRELASLRDALNAHIFSLRVEYHTNTTGSDYQTALANRLRVEAVLGKFRGAVLALPSEAADRLYTVTTTRAIDDGHNVPRVVR